MPWEVEYTDEFGEWWDTLSLKAQESVAFCVALLEEEGPKLGFPYSSKIKSTKVKNMRELRAQSAGKPYRVLYAFDPRRMAILLIGGNKGGDNRWYEVNIPKAEKLYSEHLENIK